MPMQHMNYYLISTTINCLNKYAKIIKSDLLSYFFTFKDTVKEFFNGSSAVQRGTMYHIKNKFDRRSAASNVMATFNHVTELLHFITEGNVCLIAMSLKVMYESLFSPANDMAVCLCIIYLQDINISHAH